MYFKTKRTSATGKKFQTLMQKRAKVLEAQNKLSKKYGFEAYRQGYWNVWGGISSCAKFKETPNPKNWKKGATAGEYMPSLRSKVGKKINEDFENLPTISFQELNACVGLSKKMGHIGFSGEKNPDYFGFSVNNKWDFEVPDDCTEITYSEYKEIF